MGVLNLKRLLCRLIENRSRLPDLVETSFWALWTRLDVLSKSQTRHEDVRSPLHPLKGHLVHFRRFFKTFLLGVQDSNLAESGVFLLILSESSGNLARGYSWTPCGGVQIMRPHRKWISASRRRRDFVLGSMDAP